MINVVDHRRSSWSSFCHQS